METQQQNNIPKSYQKKINSCCYGKEQQRKFAWRSYFSIVKELFSSNKRHLDNLRFIQKEYEKNNLPLPQKIKHEIIELSHDMACPNCLEDMNNQTYGFTKCPTFCKLCSNCKPIINICPTCNKNI